MIPGVSPASENSDLRGGSGATNTGAAPNAFSGGKMNYYRRYVGDYTRKTALLSVCEHGAYNLLLDQYYSTIKPLPADIASLCKICRATEPHERDAVTSVAAQFFPIAADGLRHNKRADEEIIRWNAQAEVNREIGKRGGRPRKTDSVSSKEPNGFPENNRIGSDQETEPKPLPEVRSQKLEVINQKPEKKDPTAGRKTNRPAAGDPPEFMLFKETYPQRNGSQPWARALRSILARLSEGHRWDEILNGAVRYAQWCRHTRKIGTEVVMQAATFCGREKFFAAPWNLPPNKTEVLQAANIDVANQWLGER